MSAPKLKPVDGSGTEVRDAPSDVLSATELAPILVAKAEMDGAIQKLTKVREVLRRAKQLGSRTLHAERDDARDAAAQLLGEKLDGPLGAPPKRTISEEDKLMSAALPDLERREKELNQELLASRGYLRAAVCNALNAALRRKVASYVEAVGAVSAQLVELFALDERLASLVGAYKVDPVGVLKKYTVVAAPPREYLPAMTRVVDAYSVAHLLHGLSLAQSDEMAAAKARLRAQLETHVSLDAL